MGDGVGGEKKRGGDGAIIPTRKRANQSLRETSRRERASLPRRKRLDERAMLALYAQASPEIEDMVVEAGAPNAASVLCDDSDHLLRIRIGRMH